MDETPKRGPNETGTSVKVFEEREFTQWTWVGRDDAFYTNIHRHLSRAVDEVKKEVRVEDGRISRAAAVLVVEEMNKSVWLNVDVPGESERVDIDCLFFDGTLIYTRPLLAMIEGWTEELADYAVEDAKKRTAILLADLEQSVQIVRNAIALLMTEPDS